MELALSRLPAKAVVRYTIPSAIWICSDCRVTTTRRPATTPYQTRSFASSPAKRIQQQADAVHSKNFDHSSYSQPAANVSQNVSQAEKIDFKEAEKHYFDRIEEDSKNKQVRAPWLREGSDVPPVQRNRSAGAMTKGKLLTTPSRMLKLILPLTTRDANKDRKDVEPLALLVHPQQPLSYLERLIQSELPMLEDNGKERAPSITFRAQDST